MAVEEPQGGSAESRLNRLIDRLLEGAQGALAKGDVDQARSMAEDVITVDPDNAAAADIIRQLDERRQGHGQRTVMTVLFSDLVDSTPLAEGQEPEIVRDVFALYREEANRCVERYGGHIVNYLGDGVIATFGYPEMHEDDARRAVSAGLDLVRGMQKVARQARDRHGVDARVRVGIHTGVVVVADIGTGSMAERDAIVGVTPNLAARIQAAAKPGMVAISDVTEHIVEDDFAIEPLGPFSLRGISRDVFLFNVTGTKHVADKLRSHRFEGLIVGRAGASEALREKWGATTTGGQVPATLLIGEAGIGKSRLVADFRSLVEKSHGALFELGCLPYYANSSLWPVSQALQRNLGIMAASSEKERAATLVDRLKQMGLDLGAAVPLLAPLIGVDRVSDYPAPELDPTALLRAVLEMLVRFVTAMAPENATAFIIEDLQWADPSTLEFVGMLAAAPLADLMVIGTSRTTLAAPWVDAVETIELGHLDAAQSGELVDLLAGEGAIDPDVRKSIVDRAGGIPLFIEELTRSALAVGSAALPVRLQEVLTARLKAPGVDLALAQAAATDGVEFDSSVLAAVVPDAADLARRLASLEEADIVEKLADPAGTRYRFRHALLRDAAYESQVLDARRAVHGKIASVLDDRGGDAAVIAGHYDRAGDLVAALAQYGVAVQAAQASGAHAEAIHLATRALELIGELPDGPERNVAELGTLMLRGLSVSSISGYAAPEVGEDFRRANQLSEMLGTAPEIMPAAFAIWSFALVNGDIPTAKLLAERLRGRVEDGSGAWFEPEVDAALGYQALYEGDLVAATDAFSRSLDGFAARPSDQQVSEYWPLPNDPIAVTQVGLAVTQTLRGDVDRGAELGRQAIARAEAVPFPQGPFSMAFVKVYLAWLALILGDRQGSQRLGEETTAIGQQHGYAYWMALGSIYHQVTAPNPEDFKQTIATLRAIGHEAFQASYLAYLANLQNDAGLPGEALETIADAMLVIGKSGEMLHLPDVLRLRAQYTLEFGDDPADALADISKSLELARQQHNAVYGLRAAVEMANLPPEIRPDSWREALESQVALFSTSAGHEELRVARRLLGGQ